MGARFTCANPGCHPCRRSSSGPYMPEGWTGTADWVFWNRELGGFVLGDMKTIKGDGIAWVERDGVKREHLPPLNRLKEELMLKEVQVPSHPDSPPAGVTLRKKSVSQRRLSPAAQS